MTMSYRKRIDSAMQEYCQKRGMDFPERDNISYLTFYGSELERNFIELQSVCGGFRNLINYYRLLDATVDNFNNDVEQQIAMIPIPMKDKLPKIAQECLSEYEENARKLEHYVSLFVDRATSILPGPVVAAKHGAQP